MKIGPLSVRTRLTLWHAGVLTLIVCGFSAAILSLVKARLFGELDLQLGRELAIIDRIYREEPGELADLAPDWSISLFQVAEGDRIRHQTEGWERAGLAAALQEGGAGLPVSWTAPDGRRYRLQTAAGPSYSIAAALEETSLRRTLSTLAIILATAIPFTAALAIVAGYFLAGRVLAPVGAMADKAREITVESLGERLPVDNPQDEFGRLASVFNDTLSRLHDSFERLRRFTADASHELRTPLTALRSVGEVALQGPLDPTVCRDVIGSMLEEVDRLAQLVDSLLTLTRAESGKIRPTHQVLDLGGLASDVVDQLRVLAEEKQQRLSIHADRPVSARCDPALLRLGLMNLLHNAIKYSPSNGVIRVAVTTTPAGQPAIEVQDTGPGIAAAHRQLIFERFYRVDAGRSGDSGGVGLGLAIARWAVEANAGRIELESEEGNGSLFRVVLPATAN